MLHFLQTVAWQQINIAKKSLLCTFWFYPWLKGMVFWCKDLLHFDSVSAYLSDCSQNFILLKIQLHWYPLEKDFDVL